MTSKLLFNLNHPVVVTIDKIFVFVFIGHGMPYVPAQKSIIAANLDKIRRVRNLAFKSTGSADGEMQLMSKIISFEKEIQQVMDTPEKGLGKCC